MEVRLKCAAWVRLPREGGTDVRPTRMPPVFSSVVGFRTSTLPGKRLLSRATIRNLILHVETTPGLQGGSEFLIGRHTGERHLTGREARNESLKLIIGAVRGDGGY